MLVISSSLVLVPGSPTLDPALPLIGWQNQVTTGNLVADTANVDFPASNVANQSTVQRWVAGDQTEQFITVTIGTTDPIDYLAVARHNFGSASIAVAVEGYTQVGISPPGPIWETLVGPRMLGDDSPLMFRFPAQSLAGIRLHLYPGAVPATAAVLYVGKLLVMEIGMQLNYTPLKDGRVANAVTGVSANGNLLGRIVINQYAQSTAIFSYLDGDWFIENMRDFISALPEQFFFFVWDPEDHPDEVGYAAAETPLPTGTIHQLNGMRTLQLVMSGIVK